MGWVSVRWRFGVYTVMVPVMGEITASWGIHVDAVYVGSLVSIEEGYVGG